MPRLRVPPAARRWVVGLCHIIPAMKPKEVIFAVEESPEGGYEAHALGYAIYTQADSLDELRQAVREAVQCHFEEDLRPAVIRLHIVKDEVISA